MKMKHVEELRHRVSFRVQPSVAITTYVNVNKFTNTILNHLPDLNPNLKLMSLVTCLHSNSGNEGKCSHRRRSSVGEASSVSRYEQFYVTCTAGSETAS